MRCAPEWTWTCEAGAYIEYDVCAALGNCSSKQSLMPVG